MYQLIIANRNYSSWSLRAWLYLKESGIAFEEIYVPLFTETWKETIERYTPAGRVPVLIDGNVRVWDTMAIMGHLHEKHPEAIGWPEPAQARAEARSISAEMHSGFIALRDELPQNLRTRATLDPGELSDTCRAQVRRIDEIWGDCRERFGRDGPWLFGGFSIADVFYAPVALRFLSYSIPVSDRAVEFIEAVQNLSSVREWVAAAREEPESLEFIDNRLPAQSSPLTLG